MTLLPWKIPLFLATVNATQRDDSLALARYSLHPTINLRGVSHTPLSIRLLEFSCPYVFPNIKASLNNNQFHPIISGTPVNCSLRDGLYAVNDINESVHEAINNANFAAVCRITFQPDTATNTVTCTITATVPVVINWSLPNNNIANVLGFTGTINHTTGTGHYESTDRPRLNSTTAVLVHCSHASGSYFGSKGNSDVVASIPINVAPGRSIQYAPSHPPESGLGSVDENIDSIDVYLTNQNNEPLETRGEDWLVLLEIQYMIKMGD